MRPTPALAAHLPAAARDGGCGRHRCPDKCAGCALAGSADWVVAHPLRDEARAMSDFPPPTAPSLVVASRVEWEYRIVSIKSDFDPTACPR